MTAETSVLRTAIVRASDQPIRHEVTAPDASFIVQAPAGSGKTTLLVSRYLRLLALVNQPEEILAITFTRKAAHEMKTRILAELAQGESEGAKEALDRSRLMNWDLELNPQRLKIQTIDSFAYSLVQRMPYESQLSLDYQRLDDATEIYDDATAQLIGLVFSDTAFADDIATILSLLDNNYIAALGMLSAMLSKRQHWIAPIRAIMTQITAQKGSDQFLKDLSDTREKYIRSVIEAARMQLPDELYKQYGSICHSAAQYLEYDFNEFSTPKDWRFLARTLVTQAGTLRKTVTKRNGFPPGSAAKDLCLDAIEKTRQLGLEVTLARLFHLPDAEIPDAHSESLESLVVVLTTLLEQLNQIFRQREIIDFTELAFAAQRALARDELPTNLALALDYRISHILIDEYQDTSQAQFDLLERVMDSWTPDSGNTFFAVGDPMQSIYGFRDADLKLFQDTYANGLRAVPIQPRQLSSNFRSSETIVNWINRVFRLVFGNINDSTVGAVAYADSTPTREPEGGVQMTLCLNDPDALEEARQVAKHISKTVAEFPRDSVGLLVQRRTNLPTFFQALRDEGLKWRGVEIVPLANAPVVRDLFSLVQALNDDRDRLAWLSVLRSPLCGLSLRDLEVVAACETGTNMLDCSELSALGNRLLARVTGALLEARSDSHMTLRSQVERLWYRLGGNDAYQDEDTLINAERFLTLLEASTRGEIRMDELWHRIESEYATEVGDSADVEIMTIHKAKGLEFDHVILPDLNRGPRTDTRGLLQWQTWNEELVLALNLAGEQDSLFDWLLKEDSLRNANELKRLLYVAATRARKSLAVFGSFPDDKQKPKPNSLLALLEPVLHEAQFVAGREIPSDANLPKSTILTRLDPSYEFAPPETIHEVPRGLLSPTAPSETTLAPIGFQRELALGNLVHRELRFLADTQDYELKCLSSERISAWRNSLRAEGVDGSNLAWVLERAQQHLQRVVSDPAGRWVLSNTHGQAQSEAPFSAWLDDTVRSIVVDRTFVDADGTRWIIDYKTAMLNKRDEENFEQYVGRRYAGQLALYSTILRKIDDRPVRCAIYLTDIPQLVEIDLEKAVA